jgi:hypothetical protein
MTFPPFDFENWIWAVEGNEVEVECGHHSETRWARSMWENLDLAKWTLNSMPCECWNEAEDA